MAEILGTRQDYPLLTRAALPLGVWILYGYFFFQAFLVGSGGFTSIPFGILALAVSVCLWEMTSAPALLEKSRLNDVMLCTLGALLVYGGVRLAGMSPVVACAELGTMVGILGFSGDASRQTYAGPVYCGGFVGMTSPLILTNAWWITAAGLLAGYFYSVSGPVVRGVGGKMGSIAFGGALLTVLLAKFAVMAGPGPKIIPLDGTGRLAVLMASLCAAPISYWLAQPCGLGPVLGSALPSAAIALALHWTGHLAPSIAAPMATAWFGASFVGMTLPARLVRRHWMLPVMGLLFGVLWISFKPTLTGIGGGLGATAAIAVLGVIGVARFFTLAGSALHPFSLIRPEKRVVDTAGAQPLGVRSQSRRL